ncbi:MAG: 8-amino-7-oxononanoate synthase [Candidatus Omnitrophota bacterium]|nr:8-amino-7-oxononanoate synthase [Candidatus Omnitrophota bacterium]
MEKEISELKDTHLYRRLKTLKKIDGVRAVFEGREVLLFCGNDYLGLSRDPRVIDAAVTTAQTHGVGSGAARLISGSTDWHARLEEEIARFKGTAAALLYSSGYLANLGILTALAGKGDVIVMDKLCHASAIDAARLSQATVRVFPHKNYRRCDEILQRNKGARTILVSDSVFSMDGDVADLEELVRLKGKHDGLLVIDDAHGIGVLGSRGRGAAEDSNLTSRIDVTMGTLSKSIGCLGGFAAGSAAMIDYLINFSRPFIFDTSLPPLLCAAASRALELVDQEPEIRMRLWKNIHKVHAGLKKAGYSLAPASSPIIPIVVGGEESALALAEALLREGILVPAVRYPTVPKGKARLRLTVSAAHQDRDIEYVIKALFRVKKHFFSDKIDPLNPFVEETVQ